MDKDNLKKNEMTLERAWEIATIYGKYIEEHPPALFEYQNVLPFPKDTILAALLKILVEEDFKAFSKITGKNENEMKQDICTNLVILERSFIPTEEQYQRWIHLMKLFKGEIKE